MRIVQSIDRDKRYVLLGREISVDKRRVMLTLGGDGQLDEVRQLVERQFATEGYDGVEVTVRHVGAEKFDVTQLKQELQQQVLSNTLQQLQGKRGHQRTRLEAKSKSLKSGRESLSG
ncbi:MAG: hypothetical protein IPJ12_12550 [Betaproteobacteria bacterium]|nr:hypothetical protein [Betaproteobacteria bacterium]